MAAAVGTIPPQAGASSSLQQQQQQPDSQQASSMVGGTATSVANPPPGFAGILSNFDTNGAKPSWLLQGIYNFFNKYLFLFAYFYLNFWENSN